MSIESGVVCDECRNLVLSVVSIELIVLSVASIEMFVLSLVSSQGLARHQGNGDSDHPLTLGT